MNARYLEAEELLFDTMPPALPDAVCHGDYRLGNMLCDGTEVAALIDWEIWSLSDPRLDLAWFLFFTDEAKHPMASNPGPTGMPTAERAARRLRRGVRRGARQPRVVPLPHPLQGGGRDRAAHEAAGQVGRRRRERLRDDPRAHRRVHRPLAGFSPDAEDSPADP